MIKYLVDNLKIVKRFFYAGLALFVLVDFFVPREHVTFFWDKIPGFSALYGFVSCLLIIVVSKALGHYWLMKREGYYEPGGKTVAHGREDNYD